VSLISKAALLVSSTPTSGDVVVHQEQLDVSAVNTRGLSDGSNGDVMEAVQAATQQLPLQPSHAPHSQYMSDHVLLGASVVACLHVSDGYIGVTGLARQTVQA
jgi:hypothetical protein